ncbi:MAG: ABC transporter permease [Gemmatimonadota bacterium]
MAHPVEVSRAALEQIRALPVEERRAVARAVDALSSAEGHPGKTGTLLVPAGAHTLVCVVDEDGRVVVVTLRAAGTSPGRTLREALGRAGRLLGRGGGMREWTADLRHAARSLRRAPGYGVAAVLTLAMGIGATAAVFSVANGVLLEPLPYQDPGRLVSIWSHWADEEKSWVSWPEYVAYQQQAQSLADAALYFTSEHNFTSVDAPERVGSAVLTANAFSVLGVRPWLGRFFTQEEAVTQASVVVLGYDIWQRRFSGDPAVVGRTVEINGLAFEVLGVLPPDFRLPIDYAAVSPSEVFFPAEGDATVPVEIPRNGGDHGYYVIARLADGASVESVRVEMDALAGRWVAEGLYDESRAFRPLVIPVTEDVVGKARGTILLLLGACGLVLLIACGNVANLTLSRSERRTREVAVRRALGAGRGRILRQLAAESVLLATLGGALGLLLAWAGVHALLGISPDAVPRADAVGLNATVLLFTVLIAAATPVLFAWLPALRVTERAVGSALYGSRGAESGPGRSRFRGLLVASQMAMAVVLLAGSALMMRTFARLMQIDLGFRTENVLTMRLTLPSASYPERDDIVRFWDDVLGQIRALQGVRAAGASRLLPLASQMGDSGFNVVGYVRAPDESTAAEWQFATPGYIEAMGIPVLEGRAFLESDRGDAVPAMLINEAAARRYWAPGVSPLGSRVRTFSGDTATIVGVVGNIRHNGVTSDARERWYRTPAQITSTGNLRRMSLVVHTDGDPLAVVGAVRDVIRRRDPAMPLAEVRTLDDVVSSALARPRFAMVLLSAFGAVALALSLVGAYGVLAYLVSLRTQEIGVRMALGATRGTVVRMVVGQGLGMAAAGVLAGTVLAFFLTRLMESQLYGVGPRDPVTFTVVPLLFAGVAAVACLLPGVRAAGINPTQALGVE